MSQSGQIWAKSSTSWSYLFACPTNVGQACVSSFHLVFNGFCRVLCWHWLRTHVSKLLLISDNIWFNLHCVGFHTLQWHPTQQRLNQTLNQLFWLILFKSAFILYSDCKISQNNWSFAQVLFWFFETLVSSLVVFISTVGQVVRVKLTCASSAPFIHLCSPERWSAVQVSPVCLCVCAFGGWEGSCWIREESFWHPAHWLMESIGWAAARWEEECVGDACLPSDRSLRRGGQKTSTTDKTDWTPLPDSASMLKCLSLLLRGARTLRCRRHSVRARTLKTHSWVYEGELFVCSVSLCQGDFTTVIWFVSSAPPNAASLLHCFTLYRRTTKTAPKRIQSLEPRMFLVSLSSCLCPSIFPWVRRDPPARLSVWPPLL